MRILALILIVTVLLVGLVVAARPAAVPGQPDRSAAEQAAHEHGVPGHDHAHVVRPARPEADAPSTSMQRPDRPPLMRFRSALGADPGTDAHAVQVDPQLLAVGGLLWRQPPVRLSLPLPAGGSLPIDLVEIRIAGDGAVSAAGRLPGIPGSVVSLGRSGDALALAVNDPSTGLTHSLRCVAPGRHVYSSRPLAELAQEVHCPECAPPVTGPVQMAYDHAHPVLSQPLRPLAASIGHQEPVEMALRVFASPDLVQRRGLDAIRADANSHVAFLNTAFADSAGLEQVDASLLAVLVAEGWSEQGSYSDDLDRFGAWLGERYGASLTSQNVVRWWAHRAAVGAHDSMLLHDKRFGGTVGVGWIGQTPALGSGRYSSMLQGNILVAHELGHNFGSQHTSSGIMQSGVYSDATFSAGSKDQMAPVLGNTGNFPTGRFILPIPAVTVDGEDSTGAIPFFMAGTTDAKVELSAVSSDQELIADTDIRISGAGKVRRLEGFLTPGPTGAVTITLAAVIGGTTVRQEVLIDVVANGADAGTVAWASQAVRVDEDAGSLVLYVERLGGSRGPASVAYSLEGTDAGVGIDVAAADGVLRWADGEGGRRAVTVELLDDTLLEDDELFRLVLDEVSGAELGADGVVVVTIVDDDVPPTRRVGLQVQPGWFWSNQTVSGVVDGERQDFAGLPIPDAHRFDAEAVDGDG